MGHPRRARIALATFFASLVNVLKKRSYGKYRCLLQRWPLACIRSGVTDQDTPTPTIKYPQWQREFEAAIGEADPQSLRQRVDVAEAALFLRSQELAGSAQDQAEQQAISKAMETLRAIQMEKLGYLDWRKK
jgi:hypothetical protein